MEKELINNSQSNIYPFHMPGHKRRGSDIGSGLDPYAIDITEIDNFDNLHHAEGIIKEAQAEAAALYGAKRAYFLIKRKHLRYIGSNICGHQKGRQGACSKELSQGGVSCALLKAASPGVYIP